MYVARISRRLLGALLATILALVSFPATALAVSDPNRQLPASYYLTNDGLVTPVKLQNPWGTCWAFAIASALESSILKASGSGSVSGDYSVPVLSGLNASVDVSERSLAWFSHEAQTEESGGSQAGEGYSLINPDDPFAQLSGGSFRLVDSILAAGQGLLSEMAAPYEYNGYDGDPPWYSTGSFDGAADDARIQDWSLDIASRELEDTGWRVSGICEAASPANLKMNESTGMADYQGYNASGTRQIKEMVLDIGAVAIALESDTYIPTQVARGDYESADSAEHFTFSTWSQYFAGNEALCNHAAAIVGWDDAYPAASFAGSESGSPVSDGAWLCKNNWGSDELFAQIGSNDDNLHWGLRDDAGQATGFFWLSYYDHSIAYPTAFMVEPVDAFAENIYQYDYLSTAEYDFPSIYDGDVLVANIYSAPKAELLRSISAYTFSTDETVDAYVYTFPSGTSPAELEPEELFDQAILQASSSKTFEYGGYHVFDLEDPVMLDANSLFAVVEEVHISQEVAAENEGGTSYLALEAAYTQGWDDPMFQSRATVVANPGESFVKLGDADWESVEDYNDWYADLRQQGGLDLDIVYGNAIVKAMTDDASDAYSDQIVKTVKLQSS